MPREVGGRKFDLHNIKTLFKFTFPPRQTPTQLNNFFSIVSLGNFILGIGEYFFFEYVNKVYVPRRILTPVCFEFDVSLCVGVSSLYNGDYSFWYIWLCKISSSWSNLSLSLSGQELKRERERKKIFLPGQWKIVSRSVNSISSWVVDFFFLCT